MLRDEAKRYPSEDIQKFLSGEPIEFQYNGLIDARFNFISGFLYRLLHELDLGYLSEMILVLIKEILSNNSKAIAKRVYFTEIKENINDPDSYSRVLPRFSHDVLSNWDEFVQSHKNFPWQIDLKLQKFETHFQIMITNPIPLLPVEESRIQKRFESFSRTKDMNLSFSEIQDDSEGAGLGLVLSLVLLNNSGINTDNFTISNVENKTITEISIPLSLTTPETSNKFKERILTEVRELPSFPQNITYILNLCSSDSSSVHSIAQSIQKDPSLTAQVFKLVNSAGYMNRFKEPTMEDAVKILGLKVIRNLLIVTGARNVINTRYHFRELGQIWEESNRVSFFARNLSRQKPRIAEVAPIAGLLCDLGKIVLISLNPNFMKEEQNMMTSRRIRNGSILEEISIGISNSEIGSLLAEKWNFPEVLSQCIRYQQKPLQAPAEYADLIKTVYLATRIQDASIGLSDFYGVEPDILMEFGLTNKASFNTLVKQLDEEFKNKSDSF